MDSKALRKTYTRSYYMNSLAGHARFKDGVMDIRALPNVLRAYSLALKQPIEAACDLGCGRGELSKHLLDEGARVTLVDYSQDAIEIARQVVGGESGARFLAIDAATLSDHVPDSSQDAIFLADFVEHVSKAELAGIFEACARALKPEGALVVHTPEKTCGSILTKAAVHEKHINLMEIHELRDLLRESFSVVEAFTWNGSEQFHETGRSIELFAVAMPERGSQEIRLADGEVGSINADESMGWVPLDLASKIELPSKFGLHMRVQRDSCEGEVSVQLLARTANPDDYLWTGFRADQLQCEPAQMLFASALFTRVGQATWSDVSELVLRARATGGGRVSLRVSDLVLLRA